MEGVTDRGSAEDNIDEASNVDVGMVGGTENSEALQKTENANDTSQAQNDDTGATTHGGDEDPAMDQKKASVQVFQIMISLRDDWLHRGDALQDMDIQTYAEHIERKWKPTRGTDVQNHAMSITSSRRDLCNL